MFDPHSLDDVGLNVSIDCKYYEPDQRKRYIESISHTVSYMHLNCQGLSAKWEKIQMLFSSLNQFDFIALSEAYHHEHDFRLHVPGYHPLYSKLKTRPK